MNPYQPGMTLAVLKTMADGRRRDAWDRTSWLLAKIHNVNCSRACDRIEPADCNPMRVGPARGSQQTSAEFHAAMHDALAAGEEGDR